MRAYLAIVFAISFRANGQALSDIPSLIEQSIPFQRWTAHGPTVKGLIFTTPADSSHVGMDWMREFQPHQPYWFSVNGDSPQVLYWPSHGEGEYYLTNWQVPTATGGIRLYNASMYTRSTVNTYGLRDEAHVVTLEVNDKYGSTDGLHFVATQTEVDTRFNPAAAFPVMRVRSSKWFTAQNVASQKALEKEENVILNSGTGGIVSAVTTTIAEFPTFTNGRLYLHLFRQTLKTVKFPPVPMNELDTSSTQQRPPPPPQYKQRVVVFGVQNYIVYSAGPSPLQIVQGKVASSPFRIETIETVFEPV